jgi:hypothetical protein
MEVESGPQRPWIRAPVASPQSCLQPQPQQHSIGREATLLPRDSEKMFVDEGDYLGGRGSSSARRKPRPPSRFHWPGAARSSPFPAPSSGTARRCSTRAARRQGLGPPHPPSERLVVDRQLRSDLLDGFPLRGALALVIEDHLHGAFSGLRRIWTSCAIPPPVASAVG